MKYLVLFILLFAINLKAEVQKPYKVYLKPGAVLTKLSDKTEVILTKGIFVNVLETNPTRRDHYIVYDKKGKALYTTEAAEINEIAEDTRLLPKVSGNVTYPAPVFHHSDDQVAFLDTNFNLHLDNFQLGAFQNFYQATGSSVIGARYELRTLYNSDMPVNFGISLNYQALSFLDSENENINFSILSFGPQLERLLFKEELLSLSIVGGGEFAPIYKATSSEFTEEYKALLFNIGLEGTWNTRFGKWSLGTHFRYHDLTLSESSRTNISPVPESITTSSIGVMAGYKYEWDL